MFVADLALLRDLGKRLSALAGSQAKSWQKSYTPVLGRRGSVTWLDLDEALAEYHLQNFKEQATTQRTVPKYDAEGHRLVDEDMVLRGFHEIVQ